MSATVRKLPTSDMFAEMQPKIDALRLQRGAAIKAAMVRRDAALAAAERHRAATEHAVQEAQLAADELNQLIDIDEKVVIGDTLIQLNKSGGICITPVKVLGLF